MRLLLPFLALFIILSALSPPAARAQRDHYNEYDFEVHPAAPAPPFVLIDQFGVTQHTTALYDRFLVPTTQDEDPIIDPDAFLTRYFIGFGGEPLRVIAVSNKFGEEQNWTLQESFALLNPSLKNAPGGDPPLLNHYKCYIANGPFIGTTVTLSDQYGTYQVVVTEPAVWCNPAEKRLEDGTSYPVVDEFAYLGCYFTEPATFLSPPVPVTVTDQFGTAQLALVSREVLCVPSLKLEPVPVETASWGQVKATFR